MDDLKPNINGDLHIDWPECRSLDCDRRAEFRAVLPAEWARRVYPDRAHIGRGHLTRDPWEGVFCAEHLMRCLELKIHEIPTQDVAITIWRLTA